VTSAYGSGENSESLDRQLLEAHARADTESLIRLYVEASEHAEARQQEEAAGFYLTHAFVFALEAGVPEAADLNRRLAEQGRAQLLVFETP
jgi:hypothetical protein